MVKSIIKRVIVSVLVALALMYIKGGLIADVNAQVKSFSTNDNSNFVSCNNCSTVNTDWSFNSGFTNIDGTLIGNILVYSDVPNGNYIPTLSLVRFTVDSINYNCHINGYGSPYTVTNTGGLQKIVTTYSISCPIHFGATGQFSHLYIQTNGNGATGISFYSPFTIVTDENQEVINAIEQGTQDTIESQKTCTSKIINKDNVFSDDKILGSLGQLVDSTGFGVTNYIDISHAVSIKNLQYSGSLSCFYDSNKSFITGSCQNNNVSELTIPTNAKYIKITINKNSNIPVVQLDICKNGNQGVVDSNEQLNDTLNDNDVSSGTSDTLDGLLTFGSDRDTFGPVADLLLLPVTLFGAFYSGFNGTCASYNLGSLMGHNIVLPCINLRNILGSELYGIIDVAISLFMIYNIILMCIDIFDRITSFEDPFNDLYSPRHTYHGRHEGGGAYHG